MKLDLEILEGARTVLQQREPGIGFCTACCAQPTKYLFPEKWENRKQKLIRLLRSNGVARIYTACPNCERELRELGGFEVFSIWNVLPELRLPDLPAAAPVCVNLHDPCPLRRDAAQQQNVRILLQERGIRVKEPACHGEQTLCCGNIGMLRTREPERSAEIRQRRIREFDPSLPVASCCEGCLDAFRSEGLETIHVLELIFGHSRKRGWANRFGVSLGKI